MRSIILCLALCLNILFGESYLLFQGYLGLDDLAGIDRQIDAIQDQEDSSIVIEVSSSSGDISETFLLAHRIHSIAQAKKLEVIVYIRDRAIGPAAILPFLATKLYADASSVWGDMTYTVDRFVGKDLIRSEMATLLPEGDMRRQIADAMIDETVQVPGIKSDGSIPLILNASAMEKLKLLSGVWTEQEFHQAYPEIATAQLNAISPEKLNFEMERYIKVFPAGENQIGYLHIDDKQPITETTALYVQFALDYYVEHAVSCILLNLDTPGGELLASIKIATLLQAVDGNHQIPVICFINNWALSGGAMIAYACRFIGVTNQSLMGAAQAIMAGPDGNTEVAPAKVQSVLKAEMSALATFFGRNPMVAEAMTDANIIVVKRKGELVFLQTEQEIEPTDQMISPKGQILTLHANQLLDLNVAQFIVPIQITSSLTAEDMAAGHWSADKELAFQQPYLKSIPHGEIISYSNWKIAFFSILTSPLVSTLLFMLVLIGFYLELQTPGFGVAGTLATLALVALLVGSFVAQTASWLEVVTLICGIILLLIELYIIPGFGIVGILGILLTITGTICILLPGINVLGYFDWNGLFLFFYAECYRVFLFALALVISFGLILLLMRFLPSRFKSFRRLVNTATEEGWSAADDGIKMPPVGVRGETYTPLSPAGKVQIGDSLYSASAEVGFIEKGVQIVVVRVEGSRVIVTPVEE